jgi:hypothetical protein
MIPKTRRFRLKKKFRFPRAGDLLDYHRRHPEIKKDHFYFKIERNRNQEMVFKTLMKAFEKGPIFVKLCEFYLIY